MKTTCNEDTWVGMVNHYPDSSTVIALCKIDILLMSMRLLFVSMRSPRFEYISVKQGYCPRRVRRGVIEVHRASAVTMGIL